MIKKHSTAHQLLTLLSDGGFHSGEDLGKTLKMTRSAIWKGIKQLESSDIIVESLSGKGYCIPNGLDLLEEAKIRNYLDANASKAIDEFVLLGSTESTNDFLLSQIDTTQPKTIACFAEQQTKGKGRRGRSWVSPFGNNIYHSLLWNFDKDPSELMGLSLAIAVASVRALNQYGIEDGLELKWPNDIFWKSHKLAGILIELIGQPHEGCEVVIGIGINTRLSEEQIDALNRPITSIEKITQEAANRNQLAGLLLNALVASLQEFEKHGLASFLKEWGALDMLRGKTLNLQTAKHSITGIMQGISEKGALLLLDKNGKVQPYLSGETTLEQKSP